MAVKRYQPVFNWSAQTLVETDDNSLLGTSGAGAISLPIDTPNHTWFVEYQ
jgi:hypothetical protein